MAPPLKPERREELLERCVEYVVQNGLAGLSLRPLAAAAGTSARMLLYHFGTKDDLILAALTRARARMIATAPLASGSLRDVWRWVRDPSLSAYWRLLLEAYVLGLSGRAAYAGLLPAAVADWLQALPQQLDEASRTLVLAGVGGLLLDLAGTGDVDRADAAAARLFALIEEADRCRDGS